MAAYKLRQIGLVIALAFATEAAAGIDWSPSFRLITEGRYDSDAIAVGAVPGAGQFMTKLTPELGWVVRDGTTTVDGFYAPDLLIRLGSGTVSLDHRGALAMHKRLTDRLSLDTDLRVWRVSDSSSLPRLGMARSLAPVLYGRADASAAYRISRRWLGRAGYRFEGAQVYEAGRAPSWMHSPYAEAWYRLTRRAEAGLEYRLQLFAFDQESSLAHGATAAVRYRLTRATRLTVRGGPVWYAGTETNGGFGLMPRFGLELGRDGEVFDVAFALGHDLVGASGFSSAIWADYASVMADWRLGGRFRLFGAASLYRNGRAPNEGWLTPAGATVSNGYALGVGLEWGITRALSLQVTADRYAQLGELRETTARTERDIAAAKLIFKAW